MKAKNALPGVKVVVKNSVPTGVTGVGTIIRSLHPYFDVDVRFPSGDFGFNINELKLAYKVRGRA